MAFLEANALSRRYGATLAVDGVSFELERGELLAVFGPNGAGKSSLLRMLAGTLIPDSGSIALDGAPLQAGDREWHAKVGVLSHKSFLYDALTAAENLHFYARLFAIPNAKSRIDERLHAVGLHDRRDSRAGEFSRGMRQRLALARTLLHDPTLVLLDEPYTGLDPHAAALLRGVLHSLRTEDRAVVLVTHNLVEGANLADRVAILDRGKVRYEASAGELPSGGIAGLYHDVLAAEA